MIYKNLFLLSVVLLSNTATAAVVDIDDDDSLAAVSGRKLQALPLTSPPSGPWKYKSPKWWAIIKDLYTGNDLKRCRKRQFPPQTGDRCARREKTCFWGDQICDGLPVNGAYPTTKCSCDGKRGRRGTWTCEPEACPPPTVTPPPNSCPLVIDNPADCPVDNPLFTADLCSSASLISETCNYGSESCCGNCFPSFFCSCDAVGSGFGCGNTDACFFPACRTPEQEAAWATLVGTQCNPVARDAVLADYPGMLVLCIDDTFPVTADFSISRVRIFFDGATGLVSLPPTVG